MEPIPTSERLSRVSPRTTYVILCWDGSATAFVDAWRRPVENDHRPTAILGPFTQLQAQQVAATLTCECEVTNVTTEPPAWAL